MMIARGAGAHDVPAHRIVRMMGAHARQVGEDDAGERGSQRQVQHAISRQMLSVEQEYQQRHDDDAAADAEHTREKSDQEPERQIGEPPRFRAPCFHAQSVC